VRRLQFQEFLLLFVHKKKRFLTSRASRFQTLIHRMGLAWRAAYKETSREQGGADMAETSIFEAGLEPCAANHVPLSPLSFLRRAERVFPGKIAVTHHDRAYSYAAFATRVRKFATAIRAAGVKPGECVAVLSPNGPVALEAHYAVPLAGAVLGMINTLLDPAAIAFILNHAEAKLFLVDREWAPRAKAALAALGREIAVVEIADEGAPAGLTLEVLEYEDWIAPHAPADWSLPEDEWRAIAVNYTSGTTGNPKGVVYHHRGAYLGALGIALAMNLTPDSRYLWTLPMFHCSGWTLTWAVTALGGTHVCLRKVEAGAIFDHIVRHQVTHMCGAPIVLSMLVHAKPERVRPLPHRVVVATAGAAPPSAVIEGTELLGFKVQHVYGLTEVYGPTGTCEAQPEWADLELSERARLMARQGVPTITQEDLSVLDPEGQPVPKDGTTIGELAFRGNVVMKGYLKNPGATRDAFRNGWFLTGDLGLLHADGYVQIKDRAKDIIISGGENIASLEVEDVLYRHPAVREAAVVAAPDEKWGEIPVAIVTFKEGASATEAELTEFCRKHLAGFKIPKRYLFEELPKTSTGKVQKHVLRARAQAVL
jgi:fatty-acyl-CoA synthase